MKKISLILFLLLSLSLSFSAIAAEDKSDTQLKTQIEAVLKANPALVLDIVKANPEIILDLAQQGADIKRNRAYSAQWENDMKTPKTVNLDGRPMRGFKEAPVKLIAFTDFTCSYCAQAAGTVEELLTKYNGEVSYYFKQFPLPSHENARLASEWFLAAYKQDEAKAWDLYAALFNQQSELAKGVEGLSAIASSVGLDPKKIQEDLKKNSKEIAKIIDDDMAEAEKLGFNGTPHFLVNDIVIRGAVPFEDFVNAVEMAKKAKK